MKVGKFRASRWIVGVSVLFVMLWSVGCDEESNPEPPEPLVNNYFYLTIEVISPLETKDITEVKFYSDDLKEYAYVVTTIGSRRVACQSNTFLDADDVLISEDENTLTFETDADNVFEAVDWNGNISRFSPSTTGATSIVRHQSGEVITGDTRTEYLTNLTRQINRLPNQIFEIR